MAKLIKRTQMKKMKAYQFIALITVFGLLTTVFISCNSSNQNQKSTTTIADETIEQEIEEYTYPIPSAFEVTNMLNDIEASYMVGMANDTEKAEDYFTDKSKALNLGIYTADLAYATTYNQKSEIQAYFSASETLVRELDFTSAFDQDLPDQIDANIDNKDALVEIVTDMFQGAYSYLNEQGRTELSYLILSGSVFEGLYLTTHISENTFNNPKIVEAILFQKEPLQELETIMEQYKDSELVGEVYQDIVSVNSIYALEEGSTSMSEEQVVKLTEKVTEIREKYIQ